MEELISNVEGVVFRNKDLRTATTKILTLHDKVKTALFTMAATIAEVAKTECFREDGFNSVHEWTAASFNLKQSRSYALLKIGSEWTEATLNKAGAITGHVAKLDPNFSTTQIEQMLPAGIEKARELYESEQIKPSMSAADIHKVIKKAMKEAEPEEEPELEEVNETETEEAAPADVLVYVTDEDGIVYEVPYTVLMQYRVK